MFTTKWEGVMGRRGVQMRVKLYFSKAMRFPHSKRCLLWDKFTYRVYHRLNVSSISDKYILTGCLLPPVHVPLFDSNNPYIEVVSPESEYAFFDTFMTVVIYYKVVLGSFDVKKKEKSAHFNTLFYFINLFICCVLISYYYHYYYNYYFFLCLWLLSLL